MTSQSMLCGRQSNEDEDEDTIIKSWYIATCHTLSHCFYDITSITVMF